MFADADSFMEHLRKAVEDIDDNFTASRYIGFVAVSAVTVYEVSVKQLLNDFATETHPMLGNFASVYFDKLNARIQRDDIEKYLRHLGESYSERFKVLLDEKENEYGREGSIKESYKNLLTWRHEFVHAGRLPNQATFEEAIKAYHLGKKVLIALKETLQQQPAVPPNGDE